jgi:hypothetical protein
MSETLLPSGVVSTEQDEKAQLDADYAKLRASLDAEYVAAKAKHEKDVAFGKYDTFTGPLNRGEYSHDSYHAQRPSGGIVRDGDYYKNTETGKFATAEEYAEQNGPVDEQPLYYYDKVNGITEQPVSETPQYDAMEVGELRAEAARAETLGDRAASEEVRKSLAERYELMSIPELAREAALAEIADNTAGVEDVKTAMRHTVMEYVTNPNNGVDMSDEAYDEMVANFDGLIDLAVKQQRRLHGEAVATPVVTEVAAEAEADEEPEQDAPETLEAVSQETEAAGEPKYAEGDEVFMKIGDDGKGRSEVFIQGEPSLEEGTWKYTVVNAAGDVFPLSEEELVLSDETLEAGNEAPEAESEPDEAPKKHRYNGEPVDLIGESFMGENGHLYQLVQYADGSQSNVLQSDIMDPEAEKKESRFAKAKKWWKDNSLKQKLSYTYAWMGAQWTIKGHRVGEATINHGITDEMSPEETEARRKKNRRTLIAGRAAIGIAGLAGIGLLVTEISHTLSHAGDAMMTGGHGGHTETGMSNGGGHHETATPDTSAVEAAPAPLEAQSGEGGIALLQRLGVEHPTDAWNAHAQEWLAKYPNDLRGGADGSVWLSHSGLLPDGLRDEINALK